jgi:hypothetical protein
MGVWVHEGMGGKAYSAVDDMLIARVVVDVDCDAPERGDLGGEFVEAGVVLSVRRISTFILRRRYVCWRKVEVGRRTLRARRIGTFRRRCAGVRLELKMSWVCA